MPTAPGSKKTLSRQHTPAWGIGNVVQEELRDRMKKINEDALKANAPKGSNTQKIGDFYFSGMDTVNIEKQGIAPLNDELDKIDRH
jgi:putative endopeptidase